MRLYLLIKQVCDFFRLNPMKHLKLIDLKLSLQGFNLSFQLFYVIILTVGLFLQNFAYFAHTLKLLPMTLRLDAQS